MSKVKNLLSQRHNCQLSIVNYQLRRVLLLFVVTTCLFGCKTPAVTERDTNPSTNLRTLWQILDERYCFFVERGIDWNGVLAEYAPRAAKARTVYQLYDIMADMLDTLNDGHVNLYTSFAVSSCSGWYDAYPTDFYSDMIFSERYLNEYYHINNLYYGIIDSVGYVYLSSFSTAISRTTMRYIDNYFRGCKGVIVDVRSNGGGSLDVSSALAACFFPERTQVGYMRHKEGPSHDDFSEPEPMYVDPADSLVNWTGKRVAVLCNRRSYSATNTFVNAVRHAPDVTIIGGITGGGGGMPLSQELPIGWMIRFSAIPMYDTSMKTIEFGIEPDIELHITPEDRSAGIDPILDAALALLTK